MNNERGFVSVALPILLLMFISAGITIYQKYSYNIMDNDIESRGYLNQEDIDLKLNKKSR